MFVQVFTNTVILYLRRNPRWLPENDQENVQNFTFFANILGAYMLHSIRKLQRSVSFGSDTPLELKSYD